MRISRVAVLAAALLATTTIAGLAQDAGKAKSTPKPVSKGVTVILCPQQTAKGKVNVDCAAGEKCCYQPLFDNGTCVPQSQGCLGVVNPLPPVTRP